MDVLGFRNSFVEQTCSTHTKREACALISAHFRRMRECVSLEISRALNVLSGVGGFPVVAVRFGVADAYAVGKDGAGRVRVPETDVPKG